MSESGKKNSGGLIQTIKNMIERRRAVRVERPGVSVALTIDGKTVRGLEVEDLSTRGLGIVLDFMPGVPAASVLFEKPALLKGLQIQAEIRSVRRLENVREKRYFAGYEFQFAGEAEAQQLYRWLSTRMESRKPSGGGRQNLRRAASSGGRRPEPTLVSSQAELKKCAELLVPPVVHFGLTETRFFIALTGGRVVGVLPMIEDSEKFRLPLDEKYAEFLKPLRESGRSLVQVWTPAFCKRWLSSISPRSVPLQRTDTLFSMFSLALVYAMDFALVTDLVAAPPPFLEEFFRMWLFERVPDSGGLMRLRLEGFEARAEKERPELTSYIQKIRKRVELSEALRTRFKADPEFLKAWLPVDPQQ